MVKSKLLSWTVYLNGEYILQKDIYPTLAFCQGIKE